MNEHLAVLHADALSKKQYWQTERIRLGKLFAPRTDWMLHKFTHLEASLWSQLTYYIETQISDEKLYGDLEIIRQNR